MSIATDPRAALPAHVAYVCADPGIDVFGTKGASVHVQEVVRTFRRAGARVELFAARAGGAPPDLADVVVHRLPTRPKGGDLAARERWLLDHDGAIAAAVAGAGPFDLVYERYSLFSAAAIEAAAASGVPSVLEVNAPLVDEQEEHRGLAHRDAAERTLRRVAHAASAVACVSPPVRDWVLAHAGHANAVVVPNGVDTRRIAPPPTRAGRAEVTIGFVGTLKPWHGVEVLLDAATPLLAERADVRLLLVGDGPLAADVDARVAALRASARVVRTGAVEPADVPALLHRMDIGVAPYPADAAGYFSPLKVYEYLAAGLPVVASGVGQVPGIVDDGVTGLLVPPSDPAALGAALARLAGDPGLRGRLGAAGRAQAVARHGWDGVVLATLDAAGLTSGAAARGAAGPPGRAGVRPRRGRRRVPTRGARGRRRRS